MFRMPYLQQGVRMPTLRYGTVSEHDYFVGIDDGVEAVRNLATVSRMHAHGCTRRESTCAQHAATLTCRMLHPANARETIACSSASVSASTAAYASSRSRRRGVQRSARPIASSCCWPSDKFEPRSAMRASNALPPEVTTGDAEDAAASEATEASVATLLLELGDEALMGGRAAEVEGDRAIAAATFSSPTFSHKKRSAWRGRKCGGWKGREGEDVVTEYGCQTDLPPSAGLREALSRCAH
jgi:hypothetical protein